MVYYRQRKKSIMADYPVTPQTPPLTEQEILSLGVEHREISVGFQLGDTVKIVDGPLEGFLGTVDEMDPEGNSVRLSKDPLGILLIVR